MQTKTQANSFVSPQLGLFLASVALANVLLIISAKIQVPFWPVPMTMQTAVVLAIGMGLGTRGAILAIGAYLFEGALGLPVFAGTPERGLGLPYMTGPTGGYLIGFLIAGALTGWAAERNWTSSILQAVLVLATAHAFILALGAAWLGLVLEWGMAWSAGIAPFILGTVLKAGLGAVLGKPLDALRKRLIAPT